MKVGKQVKTILKIALTVDENKTQLVPGSINVLHFALYTQLTD